VMVLVSAFVAMLAMGGRDATTHTGIADVNSVSVSGISSGADSMSPPLHAHRYILRSTMSRPCTT
jgi:hypothetical protein